MSVTGRPPSPSSAPLLWRLRHGLGRVWLVVALGTMALGGLVTLYALVVGPIETIGVGIAILIGGAFVAIGSRARK